MSNTDKYIEELENKDELDRLYQIYLRVQSGDKSALDELFKEKYIDDRQAYRSDERYKKRRMSNLDNVLDVEWILENERENEKNKQIDKWMNSLDSRVTFQFSCLNKLLYNKKKKFLSNEKDTGYENGKKKENSNHSKFYKGEYDVSDFDNLVHEIIIEIFNTKTDENNCLTLDGKTNEKYPICNGVYLLKNISYFISRKINMREGKRHFDIPDVGFLTDESDKGSSYFNKKAMEKFWKSERGTSRLSIYEEYLEWLKRNDIHKLFKTNACNIHAIIETIMNCIETFKEYDVDVNDVNTDSGFDMRLVTQEMLQEIIKFRHNINIEQGNISKDLEIIEQRMLDHLFYALNYKIDKANVCNEINEKEEPKRFLCKLDKRKYIKVFGRTSYVIYEKSNRFLNSNFSSIYSKSYFSIIKKYEDMVIDIVSLEKGKKKYDMVNLILNDDLVDNKEEALYNIANTLVSYYQRNEDEYKKKELNDYKIKEWTKGYWEAELESEILSIKLLSNKNIKKPIQHVISKEDLIVYCGYMNFYFCDTEGKICFSVPKNKRVISKANRKHEISIYDVG